MWIKKSPAEIKRLELSRLKSFLLYFAFIFLIIFFGTKIFGDNLRFSPSPSSSLEWSDVIERIPEYLVVSLFISVISFLLDSAFKKKKKNRYICDRCNNYKKEEVDDLCECGGRFIEIDKMKWIDNGDDHTLGDIS